MKKETQKAVNMIVELEVEKIGHMLYEDSTPYISVKKLRTCSATVIETEHWYLLKSYNTIVASVDKTTGVCYDFLRYVYGYTATSAQHIAKFFTDYGPEKFWSENVILTWRSV